MLFWQSQKEISGRFGTLRWVFLNWSRNLKNNNNNLSHYPEPWNYCKDFFSVAGFLELPEGIPKSTSGFHYHHKSLYCICPPTICWILYQRDSSCLGFRFWLTSTLFRARITIFFVFDFSGDPENEIQYFCLHLLLKAFFPWPCHSSLEAH